MFIEEHIKGTISIPVHEGDSYTVIEHSFTEDDIVQNSCSITSRCCDDQTFSIGGVRPAELALKLRLELPDVNAYTLYGAKIRIYSAYHTAPVPDDKWLLRGEFWVTSVKRTKTVYSLRASDAVIWLDSGSYLPGEDSGDDSIYSICSSNIRSIYSNFTDGIIYYVNKQLREAEIDEIACSIRGDITNNFPKDNDLSVGYGYAVIPREVTGGFGVRSPRDYASYLAELAAGCIQMITDPDNPDRRILFLSPYGYKPTEPCTEAFRSIWEKPVKIPYEAIELDSCDIADYELYIQRTSVKTFDGTGWANGTAFAKYQGNIALDFTDNAFLNGRYYHNRKNAQPFVIIIGIGEQLGKVKKRPFSLKCHPVFTEISQMPKLGQPILIEEKPEIWTESFITKMVWRFRGGWEFGSAGSDSRVLSQAAKRSLASHAEEKAKAYANIIANNAGASISEVRDTADYAKSTADSVNNAWNTYMPGVWNDISNLNARLSALENK